MNFSSPSGLRNPLAWWKPLEVRPEPDALEGECTIAGSCWIGATFRLVPAAVASKFRVAYPWRGDMEQQPRGLSAHSKEGQATDRKLRIYRAKIPCPIPGSANHTRLLARQKPGQTTLHAQTTKCRRGKFRRGIGIGHHAMLIVGRLSSQQRHKGHDHLIEAMPLIVQSVPDAQLVIAGAGDDRERLESKAKQLGLADSVIFTGWLDNAELDRLYSRCALFVMPSEGDGFGLVFLEANASSALRRPEGQCC